MNLTIWRKSPPKLIPFPGFVLHIIYHIDRFLRIVGLAKSYRTARKLISWYFCFKKDREIQAVRCQKKSTPYKFLAQICNLVLLNEPSIFSFMINSMVVSCTTAYIFSEKEKKKELEQRRVREGFSLKILDWVHNNYVIYWKSKMDWIISIR